MDKKLFIILVSCLVILTFNTYATGVKIRVFEGTTNWSRIFVPIANESKSSSTAKANGEAGVLCCNTSTPPSSISVFIAYTEIYAHIDMPGKWVIKASKIVVKSKNEPVRISYEVHNLKSIDNESIPTRAHTNDGSSPKPINRFRWNNFYCSYWWNSRNEYTTKKKCNSDEFSYDKQLWIGLKVNRCKPVGNYTGSITITITPKTCP